MRMAIFAVGLLLLGSPARADVITTGSFDMGWDGVAHVNIQTADGFRFSTSMGADNGVVRGLRLDPTLSSPGMTVDLSCYWAGLAVSGVAFSPDGSGPVGDLEGEDSGQLWFTSDVVAPNTGDITTLPASGGLRAAFSFLGKTWSMEGNGTGGIQLRRFAGDDQTPPYWEFVSMRYNFGPTGAEAPEPGTWLLLGTGIVGLVRKITT